MSTSAKSQKKKRFKSFLAGQFGPGKGGEEKGNALEVIDLVEELASWPGEKRGREGEERGDSPTLRYAPITDKVSA